MSQHPSPNFVILTYILILCENDIIFPSILPSKIYSHTFIELKMEYVYLSPDSLIYNITYEYIDSIDVLSHRWIVNKDITMRAVLRFE